MQATDKCLKNQQKCVADHVRTTAQLSHKKFTCLNIEINA